MRTILAFNQTQHAPVSQPSVGGGIHLWLLGMLAGPCIDPVIMTFNLYMFSYLFIKLKKQDCAS